MTKYIFLPAPAYGHVNPTLAVARELVQRGEQVVYYLTAEFQSAAEGTGALFQPYDSMDQRQLQPRQPGWTKNVGSFLTTMPMRMLMRSRLVLPQVLERIRAEQADFLVYDPMCLWGRVVAEVLHLPAIMVCPTYVSNEHSQTMPGAAIQARMSSPDLLAQIQTELNELCAAYHVSPPFELRSFFRHAEGLNIVFMPRAFQPGGETFDERYVFAGPSIAPRVEDLTFTLNPVEGQPLLFISLGTAFNNRPEFFKLCLQAFEHQPWQVVMSYGKHVDQAVLGAIPSNFQLAAYVPQLEVLARTSIFVTHGGMNSVMESLYFGVPMVVVPQMVEQGRTAQRCVELGLGLVLDSDNLTAEALRAAVEQVQQTPALRANVQAMQQTVRAAGGYQRAADAISAFARR